MFWEQYWLDRVPARSVVLCEPEIVPWGFAAAFAAIHAMRGQQLNHRDIP